MKTLKDLSELDKFLALKNGYSLPVKKAKVEFWCVYNGNAVIFGKDTYKNCQAHLNQFKGVKGLSIKPYKGI